MNVKSELVNLANNLKEILPIANSHMVHFLTKKHFENMVPKNLQDEIMSLNEIELNQMVLSGFSEGGIVPSNKQTPHLVGFLNHNRKLSLKYNGVCLSFEELLNSLESKRNNESSHHISKHLMSMKKCHEVEIMGAVVAAIMKEEKCSHVIDLGGGKGYLSSVLALRHHLKVLSVDLSLETTKGAEKQIQKNEKLWSTLKRKSSLQDTFSIESDNSRSNETEHFSKLCKFAISFITEGTDVTEMLNKSFPGGEVRAIMLAGLHTCGNLAASSIKLFIKNPDIKCLVNVGCCYNLIKEEFDASSSCFVQSSESVADGFGFPMSAYLRDQKFLLGRNARMLGTQPPDKMCHENMVETDILFYRALLELYLEKKFGSRNGMSQFKVGKLKKKCLSFTEYVHASVQRLGIDIQVDDDELQQLWDRHASTSRKQLHAFFLLKLSIAPAIEAIVMMDRLLYLQEQGFHEACLVQLFDPVVSPRCFAIVAFNRPRTRTQHLFK